MPDHKLEPFQRVLVRDFDSQPWKADLFSHGYDEDGNTFFACMGEAAWLQCIPYTPETAHLLGTSQPYEPPKPPVEYEWGQKVRVLRNGREIDGLYVGKAQDGEHHILLATQLLASVHGEKTIRPLTDTAAHADD
ncbi:MAG: hypothetical protein EOM37_18530 [Proteobacteria bacterium]|nr:hypothetical protein [Pseudomonadota bacterium]